jgi:hypothetical protein
MALEIVKAIQTQRRSSAISQLEAPALVASGCVMTARKRSFDLAANESAEWEQFLADLYRRGLTGDRLDMICVDWRLRQGT